MPRTHLFHLSPEGCHHSTCAHSSVYCPSRQVPPSPGQHGLGSAVSTKALFFSTSFKQRTSTINTIYTISPSCRQVLHPQPPVFSHFSPPKGTRNTELGQCKATVSTLGMCFGEKQSLFLCCATQSSYFQMLPVSRAWHGLR